MSAVFTENEIRTAVFKHAELFPCPFAHDNECLDELAAEFLHELNTGSKYMAFVNLIGEWGTANTVEFTDKLVVLFAEFMDELDARDLADEYLAEEDGDTGYTFE